MRLVEPKIMYSCDHNLIDRSERVTTIEVTRNVSIGKLSVSDFISVKGTISNILKVYSPKKTDRKSRINLRFTDFGSLYALGHDFLIEDAEASSFSVKWISNNAPSSGEKYYIDILYSPSCDTEYEQKTFSFIHENGLMYDRIEDVAIGTFITHIKAASGVRYTENKDFTTDMAFSKMVNGNYAYCITIKWINQMPAGQFAAFGFSENQTYKNDRSKGTILISNEDENALVSMTKQEDEDVCPRCNGTGWYVGIFEKNCHRAKKANLLLQEFVKLLYVTPADNGITLLTISGKYVAKGEAEVKALLQNIVLKSVNAYNKMITEAEGAGKQIAKSERIFQAGVGSVTLYSDGTGAEAIITVVSANGDTQTVKIDT